jgi:thioredoxin 1
LAHLFVIVPSFVIPYRTLTTTYPFYTQPTSEEALDKLLEDAASNEQLVVVDFYNDNCPPCEKVAPLFLELSESEEFTVSGGAVIFVKIKVDDHPDIATRFGITGWPTFLFIKSKEVQTEIVGGALAEATLYDWIRLFTRKPTKSFVEESSVAPADK